VTSSTATSSPESSNTGVLRQHPRSRRRNLP
jgi:hypothetical protein